MKKIRLLLLLLIVIVTSLFSTSNGVAFASTSVYSDVLADLQVDESFNVDDYPINQTDFSLSLIQIAESNDNSLLVYVYQPSAGKYDVLAKKIRMSVDDGQSFHDYDLTLLSRNSVFFKYKVDNYVTDASSPIKRTYQVVQIMRLAREDLGDTVLDEHNNTIAYIPYSVNWTFTAVNHEGVTCYGKERLNTFTVTDKYCGQLKFESDRLTQALSFMVGVNDYAMLHFIAFNTDKPIDDLRESVIEYTLNTVVKHASPGGETEQITHSRERQLLSAEVEESYQGGIFGHKYTWKEIMTKDDFVNNVVVNSEAFFDSNFTESGVEEIADKQWVFCFLTTDVFHQLDLSPNTWNEYDEYSYITDETILQFTIMEHGKLVVYGTVDNYQHGDGIPDNVENYGVNEDWWKNRWNEMQEWLKYILIFLGCVVLGIIIVLIFPFIKAIFSIIWAGIKVVFRVITAPFRFLFGSKNKRR